MDRSSYKIPNFNHRDFELIDFDQLPLNRDCFLVSAEQMEAFENAWIKFFDTQDQSIDTYGHLLVLWTSVESIHSTHLDLNICVDMIHRYHGVKKKLSKEACVKCVHVWNYEKRVYIFVDPTWLRTYMQSNFATFGLVDAIGIKELINYDKLTRKKLELLTNELDAVAEKFPPILFASFADGVLLKSAWQQEHDGKISTYSPELVFEAFEEIAKAIKTSLECDSYAVFTQGINEYFGTDLGHISKTGNHISLKSLGTSFAQLFEIDQAARKNIRDGVHLPNRMYVDSQLFFSLKIARPSEEEIDAKSFNYESKVSVGEKNYYITIDALLNKAT